jgi:DNA sulfur modification protein DndD
MKIRILGWEYKNIRRINNLKIDLGQSENAAKISLIMMPNGTGKTTTIKLMRAVLDESAKHWTADQIQEFKPLFGDCPKGEFRLSTKIGEEIYCFVLCLDYENGVASYKTSRAGEHGGMDNGLNFPYQLKGVFNPQFVKRFIFDGEQAKNTLSSENDEAEKAITYLYQLNEFENLREKIDSIVKAAQESGERGITPQSLANNRTRMDNRIKIHKELIRKKESLEKQQISLTRKREEVVEKRRALISSDSNLKDIQAKLELEKAEAEGFIRQATSSILKLMREPFNVCEMFDQRLKGLSINMQTLKLPKTMSKEFFNELSEAPKCICGHCIGNEEKKHILENAQNYLGNDQLVALNSIKDKLKSYVTSNELSDSINLLDSNTKTLEEVQSSLTRLSVQLEEQGNQEITSLEHEMNSLSQQLLEIDSELRILTSTDIRNPQLDAENNIKLAEQEMLRSTENYNKATNTYVLYQKAEIIKRYLSEIQSGTLSKLKIRILERTNKKIEEIIQNERIEIEKIDGNLVLKNRKAVSEGQTLAIAYAYIGSLFEESSFRFPFIIDSPAVSLDLSVRKEVSELLPVLFEQLVIFVISSEVENFANTFYSRNDVEYFTITAQDGDSNAICRYGQETFNLFQKTEGAK